MSKNFLLLLSISPASAMAAKAVRDNIEGNFGTQAKQLWRDSGHAGYLIHTPLIAAQIGELAQRGLSNLHIESLKDLLILEIGNDQLTFAQSAAGAWLNSHGVPRRPYPSTTFVAPDPRAT